MIDSTLLFDGTLPNTGVAITATRVSTNVIDLLAARDVGTGNHLYLTVLVTTAFTSTNSGTLQVQFETCATAGGTYKPLVLTPVVAVGDLIAGAVLLDYVVPPNGVNNTNGSGILAAPGQFARLTYTVANAFTAGAVMAWLNAAPDRNNYYTYPANYKATISAGEI